MKGVVYVKPLIIKVEKTLATIGFGVLAIELGADMGRASMLRAVKIINSETADTMMDAMDFGINCGEFHGLKKCRLKIIRGMCKAIIKE
jgi:hypothetical protein